MPYSMGSRPRGTKVEIISATGGASSHWTITAPPDDCCRPSGATQHMPILPNTTFVELMTVDPCAGGVAAATVKPSLFLEGPGHGQLQLQELRPQRRLRRLLQLVRRGNYGQRPQPPLPRPAQETSSRTRDPSTATRTHGRRHIRSTAPVPVVPTLALHSVTI